MYCRYARTSIWDHKKCPLNGGKFYCVLYRECPLSEVPLYLHNQCYYHHCIPYHCLDASSISAGGLRAPSS